MDRNRAFLDALARAELVVAVIQNFVGIHVGMYVGNNDGFGMIVQHAGAEGADHKTRALEGLVDGRRHVELARYWRETMNAEGPRKYKSIPTDDIKGVRRVVIIRDSPPRFDSHRKIAFLVVSDQLGRGADIPLVIGGMLQKLPNFILITSRNLDRTVAINRDHSHRERVKHQPIDRAPRNHQIVAG